MTDFSQNSTDENSQQASSFSDTTTTDTNVDTKSPEHQLEVMQKRINDTQNFVAQMKEENKSLRDEVTDLKTKSSEGVTAAELLDKMQTQQSDNTSDTTALDVEELRSKIAADIRNDIASDGLAKAQQDNLKQATTAAQEAFGEGWGAVIQTKLSELGMTSEQLDVLAKENPNAVTRLLGIEGKKATSAFDSSSTINTQSVKAPETTTAPANMMGGASDKTIVDRLKYHRQQVATQYK